MEKIAVKRLRPNATLPTYGTAWAAGADLYACLDEAVTIEPGMTKLIPTGLAMEIPVGFAGLIYARSGLSVKSGLAPANKVGVIDADYRGEFMVALHNHSKESRSVSHGERIAQLVITPVFTPGFREVDALSDTSRGEGGFGSTGK
jgi:dUTP pyrophosphatase